MDFEGRVNQQNEFLDEILVHLREGKTFLEEKMQTSGLNSKLNNMRLRSINNYIATINGLGTVTNDDYKNGVLSDKITEYVETINSIKEFYEINCSDKETNKMKNAIIPQIIFFQMNNDSIERIFAEETQERGIWDGRQEETISPRVSGKGKRRWKKMKTNKKRLQKKRTTKRNGRRKKN
jgi:hypothetical protein